MTKIYVSALCRLNAARDKARRQLLALQGDKRGVVSFEYIIVAACIVGAVGVVFGSSAAGSIQAALTTGVADLVAAFNKAV